MFNSRTIFQLMVNVVAANTIALSILFSTFTLANTHLDQPKLVKIAVLGDSLSAAYKLSLEQGWVALTKTHFDNMGMKVEFINASVSGITTTTGLQILPNLLEQQKPHILVIELGANDGLQGRPIKMISKNLAQLIQLAQKSGSNVLLLGVHMPPNRGKRYTEPFFEQFGDLADKYQTELVPFFMEGVAGNPEFMLDDGLHPNERGQELIKDNVYPALLKMVKAINLVQ